MKSVVLNLEIRGDSYADLIYMAEECLSNFLEVDIDEISRYVQYELQVLEDLDEETETKYVAELIARIKDGK